MLWLRAQNIPGKSGTHMPSHNITHTYYDHYYLSTKVQLAPALPSSGISWKYEQVIPLCWWYLAFFPQQKFNPSDNAKTFIFTVLTFLHLCLPSECVRVCGEMVKILGFSRSRAPCLLSCFPLWKYINHAWISILLCATSAQVRLFAPQYTISFFLCKKIPRNIKKKTRTELLMKRAQWVRRHVVFHIIILCMQ